MNWITRLFDLLSFKFAPAAAVIIERRDQKDEVLGLLQDYFKARGGIAEVMKRFERAGYSGKVRSWSAAGSGASINSVEALQLLGWKDMRDLSEKAAIPVERMRDLVAELLPVAVRKACSHK